MAALKRVHSVSIDEEDSGEKGLCLVLNKTNFLTLQHTRVPSSTVGQIFIPSRR